MVSEEWKRYYDAIADTYAKAVVGKDRTAQRRAKDGLWWLEINAADEES